MFKSSFLCVIDNLSISWEQTLFSQQLRFQTAKPWLQVSHDKYPQIAIIQILKILLRL